MLFMREKHQWGEERRKQWGCRCICYWLSSVWLWHSVMMLSSLSENVDMFQWRWQRNRNQTSLIATTNCGQLDGLLSHWQPAFANKLMMMMMLMKVSKKALPIWSWWRGMILWLQQQKSGRQNASGITVFRHLVRRITHRTDRICTHRQTSTLTWCMVFRRGTTKNMGTTTTHWCVALNLVVITHRWSGQRVARLAAPTITVKELQRLVQPTQIACIFFVTTYTAKTRSPQVLRCYHLRCSAVTWTWLSVTQWTAELHVTLQVLFVARLSCYTHTSFNLLTLSVNFVTA